MEEKGGRGKRREIVKWVWIESGGDQPNRGGPGKLDLGAVDDCACDGGSLPMRGAGCRNSSQSREGQM